MATTFSSLFPNIAELLDDGCELEIHGGGHGLKVTSICDGQQIVCMFESRGDEADSVFPHLELQAKRYLSEGIVTDEVNGDEYCVW